DINIIIEVVKLEQAIIDADLIITSEGKKKEFLCKVIDKKSIRQLLKRKNIR
ncbi:unnamed protein product, partial [marine sediment metagenome]